MASVKIGVIGAGAIAQIVHLPVLKKTPGAELVAIAEHDSQRLQIIGKQYGIPNLYQNYSDLLKNEEVEVVDICTSTETHYQIALEALKAGKNIIIEKPPTVTLAECKELAEAAEKSRKIILAGMNNRFRSDFMMLKSYIYDNQLGDIFYINAAWHKEEPSTRMKLNGSSKQSRRGVVLDLGIVLIDLAAWLLNFPKIKGINAAFFSRRFKKIEDTALITMRTSEGAMIRLDASWGLQLPGESFKFEVYGTNGTATLTPLILHRRVKDELVSLAPVQNTKYENIFKRSYETELANFVRYFQGVKSDVPTISQLVNVMQIVELSYLSAKRGSAVKM